MTTIYHLSVVFHLIKKKINKNVRDKEKIAVTLNRSTKYALVIPCA